MSLSCGIIGLPNVGKSTLFKALTKKPVDISNYPFTTIEPNEGVTEVPDLRLTTLSELLKPPKVTPAIVKFVDIAGLVKEAHKGEGLGNQFLAHIREADILIHVVRAFENAQILHTEGRIDPKGDIEIINTELALKDLETVTKHREELMKRIKSGDKDAAKELERLELVKEQLENGKLGISEDYTALAHLNLLTSKKAIHVINVRDSEKDNKSIHINGTPTLSLDVKLEDEMSEMPSKEIESLGMNPEIGKLIQLAYATLNFITFYTIKGGEELRAWPIENGKTAKDAGSVVHTDFGEKFIRAEAVSWEKLLEAGSWIKARERGLIRTEGRDYIVQDGDVIEFKI